MVYQTVFYKLLGIPKKVAEPTPYHLLGITPQVFSPELVKSSLTERKRMLRQNVPGPQFIPVVSLFEKELDAAADVLLDPDKRKALHERLLREIRDKKLKKAKAKRERQEKTAQKIIRSAVNRDGTLDDRKRPALAQRLTKGGMDPERVEAVLQTIPKPVSKAATAAGTLQYFAQAVDSAIIRNVLTEDDERELKGLARKLKIPRDKAVETILSRLKAKGAQRGQLRSAVLKAQFDEHVRAMSAKGPLNEARRAILLKLATTQGLSPKLAKEVIGKYVAAATPTTVDQDLPAAAGQPTDRKTLGQAISAELDEHAAVESAKAAERARAEAAAQAAADSIADVVEVLNLPTDQPKRALVRKACQIGIPIVAIAVFSLLVMRYGRGPNADKEEPAAEPAPKPLPKPPRKSAPAPASGPTLPSQSTALITSLLKPSNSRDHVAAIISGAKPSDVHEALEFTADLLRKGSTSLGASLAERLCRHLVTSPLDARGQAIVAQGLIRAARSAQKASRASRLANLLSSALFLRASATDLANAAERENFLKQCEKAWAESRRRNPDDPLNDPQRLVSAVAAGGDLEAYAGWAEEKRLAELTAGLAQAAADPSHPAASKALDGLRSLATVSHTPGKLADAKKAAQIALCDVLGQARDFRTASAAYSALATQAKLRPRPSSLATPAGRQELAEELRLLVTTGSQSAVPTYAARTARPTTSAHSVRRSYSSAASADTNELLRDVAITMLALCDRAMLFATGESACSSELSTLAGSAGLTERIAAKVSLPPAGSRSGPGAAPPPARKPLDARRLEELKAEVRGSSRGRRYRAIEELRAADTPGAAKALLDELRTRIGSQSEFDAGSADTATVCRILRALRSMREASIPGTLVKMITMPGNSFFAHEITKTLAIAYGVSVRRRGLVLTPLSEESERRLSQIQWQRRVRRSPWHQRRPAAPSGPTPAAETLYPDPIRLKLIAAAAHYAEYATEALKVCSWQQTQRASRPQLLPMPASIIAPDNAGANLLAGANAIVGQLARLVREHPNGSKCATKADMVELEKKARTLASDTTLQKVAVCLDAAGGLLELLIKEVDENGTHKAELDKNRDARKAASYSASNVLQEIRESGYYDLLLWDMLLAPK